LQKVGLHLKLKYCRSLQSDLKVYIGIFGYYTLKRFPLLVEEDAIQTLSGSGNEQKFGHDYQLAPMPNITVLARTCSILSCFTLLIKV
jgi:hypothetical protein